MSSFLFPLGEAGGQRGTAPYSNIFSSHAKKTKKAAKEPSAPHLPPPLPGHTSRGGPAEPQALLDLAPRQSLSRGLCRAAPLVFYYYQPF